MPKRTASARSGRVAAREVMSRPVRRVANSIAVAEAADFLLRHRISGALVVDAHGEPAGVFSLRDAATARDPATAMVASVMTAAVITVGPDDPIDEIGRLMARWRVHRVFVEKAGKIVGVVTSLDVLRAAFGGGRSRGD